MKSITCAGLKLREDILTCMGLSAPGAVVFNEVSSSKQNISSWVWSAEKIT